MDAALQYRVLALAGMTPATVGIVCHAPADSSNASVQIRDEFAMHGITAKVEAMQTMVEADIAACLY